jgi:hypothetical protein
VRKNGRKLLFKSGRQYTLFAAVAAVYEGAEDDPPICGVLQAIRDTLKGWAQATGETELFASVPYPDLVLLMRRIDVAMAMARREALRARRGFPRDP